MKQKNWPRTNAMNFTRWPSLWLKKVEHSSFECWNQQNSKHVIEAKVNGIIEAW